MCKQGQERPAPDWQSLGVATAKTPSFPLPLPHLSLSLFMCVMCLFPVFSYSFLASHKVQISLLDFSLQAGATEATKGEHRVSREQKPRLVIPEKGKRVQT